MIEPLMTAHEVARMLRIKPQTVYHKVMKRQIPFVKLGTSLRFRVADIERYIEDRVIPA